MYCVGVPIEKPKSRAPQWTTHNMSIWEDIILLSSDSEHHPLLTINQTGVYTAPDIEKMENETLNKFQILKVIFIFKISYRLINLNLKGHRMLDFQKILYRLFIRNLKFKFKSNYKIS